MILSNDGLVAFHYRSYGTFFLQQNRLHNIHRDLPTTNIIEPFFTTKILEKSVIFFVKAFTKKIKVV